MVDSRAARIAIRSRECDWPAATDLDIARPRHVARINAAGRLSELDSSIIHNAALNRVGRSDQFASAVHGRPTRVIIQARECDWASAANLDPTRSRNIPTIGTICQLLKLERSVIGKDAL